LGFASTDPIGRRTQDVIDVNGNKSHKCSDEKINLPAHPKVNKRIIEKLTWT
jgi:hypothetical protein